MPGEQDDYDSWSDEDARGRRLRSRWRRLGIAAAVIVIGGFAAISWYAYDLGRRSGGSGVAPLIVADGKPNKVRPDDPGGKVIPDQDKLVYERPRAGAPPADAERLLPPPETPLPRPQMPPLPAPAQSANPDSQPAPPLPATVAAPPAMPPLAPPARPEAPPARAVEAGPAPGPAPGPVPGPAPQSRALPAAPPAPTPPPAAPAPQAVGGGQPSQATVAKGPPAGASAPAPAAETRPAAGGAFKVQIAATRSDVDARSTWTRLQAANRDLLGSLSLTVQRADLGERGIYYRVQAGGLADAQSAQSLCAELKTRKIECMVVRP